MPFFHVLRRLNYRTSRFLTVVLTTSVICSLMLVSTGSWNIWKISQGFEQDITTGMELQQLSGEIIHLDEVLTMSARMAAATADLKWKKRYKKHEKKLDQAIKRAIEIAPESDDSNTDQTDVANQKLVAMELEAFRLVSQGQSKQALALLFSPNYEEQKAIYAEGILKTTDVLQQHIQTSLNAYETTLSRSIFFSGLSFPILTLSWLAILVLVNQYVRRRQQAERNLWATKLQLEERNFKLKASEAELRQKATVLESTLQQLQDTQIQMIQSEKMSSLGYLVAGVAHEINNPVSFIHGNLECLHGYVSGLMKCINSYQVHYPNPEPAIGQIIESVDLAFLKTDLPKLLMSMTVGTERISEIVLSLRNFSRMDESECKEVDVHDGLDSTLLILQHRLNANTDRPEIRVSKQYGDLPRVECYGGLLNQVFMNILSNAVDALEENRLNDDQYPDKKHDELNDCLPQLTIRTNVVDARWAEITIADNGPGIPEHIQPKIFEPFFTTKPVGKGTGMGMPISYQIITERHQGTLECKSKLGLGTQFIIRIPLHQTETETVGQMS